MTPRRPAITACLLAMLLPALAAAGARPAVPAADTAALCTLTVTSRPDSCLVFVDSVRAGSAPVRVDSLAPGLHRIRVLQANVASWLSPAITDSLVLAPGESRTLAYTLPQWYSLITFPSGAQVYRGDSLRGTTPLLLPPRESGSDSLLVIRAAGYKDVRVSLTAATHGVLTLSLEPSRSGPGEPVTDVPTSFARERSPLPLYLSAGAAVVAGALSAYFKIRADNTNQQFLDTGNAALRSRTTRLDTAAGISLAAAEAGLVLFSILLLSE